jgi:hypothetical protein
VAITNVAATKRVAEAEIAAQVGAALAKEAALRSW